MLLAVDPAPSLGETESELKQARRPAAHRERRILYNNDGDDITGWSSVTPAEYLSRRMAHLADTQVDSLFWCPGVTTVVTFSSQVAETYDTVIPDHLRSSPTTSSRRKFQALYATTSADSWKRVATRWP